MYEWFYTGKRERVGCPRCAGYIYRSKVKLELMLRQNKNIPEAGTRQLSISSEDMEHKIRQTLFDETKELGNSFFPWEDRGRRQRKRF